MLILYDGSETLVLSRDQADALEDFGLIVYSPEDGPNGIVYRPSPGFTLERIRRALV